ncbi:MAG TPA: DUF971 domain-containing protein [Verrucomicrobiales bacterium]|jgi:DUF971 family protein|nr:DUF971 domain-containing protein [Verrucomicrobiales bacterium]
MRKPCPVISHTRLPPLPDRANRAFPREMTGIKEIQLIGDEVAIRWTDDSEGYIAMSRLRALSPSAETAGERDLLGKQIGGNEIGRDFSKITVKGWNIVGNYAIQFRFSDGHNTGIYSFDYLREIAG